MKRLFAVIVFALTASLSAGQAAHALNPQPIPPGSARIKMLNPQPIPPGKPHAKHVHHVPHRH